MRQWHDLGELVNLQLSGDGKRILSELKDVLWVQDAATLQRIAVVRKAEGATVFLSPDGKKVLQSPKDGPPQVFDADTGRGIEGYKQLGAVFDILGFSADWSRLVHRKGSELFVLDVATGKPVNSGFNAGEGGFGQLSPEGKLLMATSADFRQVYLWFIQAGGVWDRREPSQKIDPRLMARCLLGRRALRGRCRRPGDGVCDRRAAAATKATGRLWKALSVARGACGNIPQPARPPDRPADRHRLAPAGRVVSAVAAPWCLRSAWATPTPTIWCKTR